MTWGRRVALITLAACVPVAVTYLAQPLLTLLAAEFHASEAELGWAASAFPIGYAVGIATMLPLSDRVSPRVLAQAQAVATAAFLALAAAAPTMLLLCIALACAGVGAAVVQVLVPVAVRLAPPEFVGTSTGMLGGAFLTSIFAMRVLGAWIGELAGWRTVFAVAGVLIVATIPLIRLAVPHEERSSSLSYWSIVRGLPRLGLRFPAVITSMAAQGCVYFAFNALWTAIVLHLTAPEFGWSVADAGLVGLAGLAGGLVTLATGRLIDRWGPWRVVAVFATGGLVSTSAIALFSTTIAVIIAGCFVISTVMQTTHIANQVRALQAVPTELTGSGNTLFMLGSYFAGSVGAGVSTAIFSAGGFTAVAWAGSVALVLALLTLAAARVRRA